MICRVLLLVSLFGGISHALVRQYAMLQKFPGGVEVGEPRNSHPVVLNDDTLLFAANDGVHGSELWKVDGTDMSASLLKDIRPGSEGSQIRDIFVSRTGCALFAAFTREFGMELWVTNGTADSTVLHGDLNSGPDGSFPGLFTEEAFPGVMPGPGFRSPSAGDYIYFTASTAARGDNLWRATCQPGSAEEVIDAIPGPRGTQISELRVCWGAVFFAGNTTDFGREIWGSDGIPGGVTKFTDVNPGGNSSSPKELTCWKQPSNPLLLFNARNEALGSEMFAISAISLNAFHYVSFHPAAVNFGPEAITDVEGELYWACDRGEEGYELCDAPDIARASFGFTHDINPGRIGSYPAGFTRFGNQIIFAADSLDYGGRQVWVTTGDRTGAAAAVNTTEFVKTTVQCFIWQSLNETDTCEDYDTIHAANPLVNADLVPLCNDPFTETQVVTVSTIETRNGTRAENVTRYREDGSEYQVEEVTVFFFNVTDITRELLIVDTNTYPCRTTLESTGLDTSSVTFPEADSSTFLWCQISSAPSSPMDFAVNGDRFTFRATNASGDYQLYVGIDGRGTGPPASGSSIPKLPSPQGDTDSNKTGNGIGYCEHVADTNGFMVSSVQRPVVLPSRNLTFFMGKRGGVTALWYVDTAAGTFPRPQETCTTPGLVLNMCGRCALPGDHLSCRGLTCGEDRVLNGCGECVLYSESNLRGFYDQCTCDYDPAYTTSTPGFGQYAFSNMQVAIENCQSKNLRMHGPAVITGGPVSIRSRDMRITRAAGSSPTPILRAYINLLSGSDGFSMGNIDFREPPSPSCAANSNALVHGTMESGILNFTDTLVSTTSCVSGVGVTLGGSAFFWRSRFFGHSVVYGNDHVVDIEFTSCGPGLSVRHHLNYSEGDFTDFKQGLVSATGVTSAWVTDNECTSCTPSSGGYFTLSACIHFQDEWFEVARNYFTTTEFGNLAFQFTRFRKHNIHGNVAQNAAFCMAFNAYEGVPELRGRGLPPEDQPWTAPFDSTPVGFARFFAYQNQACLGTTADTVVNGGQCVDQCGMDFVDNLNFISSFSRPALNLTGAAEIINTTLTTLNIHLEMGYNGTLVPSSRFDDFRISNISAGLQLVPFGAVTTAKYTIHPTQRTQCVSEIFDKQYRCRNEYVLVFNTGAAGNPREVVGDFTANVDISLHNRPRITFVTPVIPFEWFRTPDLRKRIMRVRAEPFLDSAFNVSYDQVTPLVVGTSIFVRVYISEITPALPGDFDTWHELKIDRAVMCYPDNAYEIQQDSSTFFSFSYKPGPVIPFVPWNPRGSGCFAPGHGMGSPVEMYNSAGSGASSVSFAPSVYRLSSQQLSEQTFRFTVGLPDNTNIDTVSSVTIIHKILRRKFSTDVEYDWPEFNNVTYINQVRYYRKCPSPDEQVIEVGGILTCGIPASPEPKPEPNSLVGILTLAGVGLAFFTIISLVGISLYKWRNPYAPIPAE